MQLMQPFSTAILQEGGLRPSGTLTQRRLSDMRGMYADSAAVDALLSAGENPLIYEVDAADLPEEAGQVLYCTTTIYPGTIGGEYFMTKGHYHAQRDRGEVYYGLSGQGYLLLQTERGDFHAEAMQPGLLSYVPPYWAHRSVNTGQEPFVFLAVWGGDAGHDYGTIERLGFARLLMERDGSPSLVENPRYR